MIHDQRCDFCGEKNVPGAQTFFSSSTPGPMICTPCVRIFFARLKKGLDQLRNEIYDGKFDATASPAQAHAPQSTADMPQA